MNIPRDRDGCKFFDEEISPKKMKEHDAFKQASDFKLGDEIVDYGGTSPWPVGIVQHIDGNEILYRSQTSVYDFRANFKACRKIEKEVPREWYMPARDFENPFNMHKTTLIGKLYKLEEGPYIKVREVLDD